MSSFLNLRTVLTNLVSGLVAAKVSCELVGVASRYDSRLFFGVVHPSPWLTIFAASVIQHAVVRNKLLCFPSQTPLLVFSDIFVILTVSEKTSWYDCVSAIAYGVETDC